MALQNKLMFDETFSFYLFPNLYIAKEEFNEEFNDGGPT